MFQIHNNMFDGRHYRNVIYPLFSSVNLSLIPIALIIAVFYLFVFLNNTIFERLIISFAFWRTIFSFIHFSVCLLFFLKFFKEILKESSELISRYVNDLLVCVFSSSTVLDNIIVNIKIDHQD